MIQPGSKLAHYEIVSALGKGGMGEVWRAGDTKLGREVAIKTLPAEFSQDAERLARFEREARLLASLNHPNIAAIYGLEEHDGSRFLVLELVEGDTLADRLQRGAVPVEESLRLALQIAEALEAAHEKGVIHRDLKPANIKMTLDGKVKVLDFGLAKAFSNDGSDANPANSPTLSMQATQQGIILGTAGYMSPEQARGRSVDARTDVWAFGCVLFEMLTGRSTFAGDDVSLTLARVLEREPDFSDLPRNLHPRLGELLGRCLEKDAKNRWQAIGDVRLEIQKVLADSGGMAPPSVEDVPTAQRSKLPWVAAIVLSALVAGTLGWYLSPDPPLQVSRFNHVLPEGENFTNTGRPVVAISPDGSRLVYVANQQLYLRRMDSMDSAPIPGTAETPTAPFFSPDGQWIGFYSTDDDQLKKIAITGGAPVTIAEAANPFGRPVWGADERIVWGQGEGIMAVSANGGVAEVLIPSSGDLGEPRFLPDGRTLLFRVEGADGEFIAVQEPGSEERKILFEGNSPLYLPTGHLVYSLDDVLLAIPFDLDALDPVGGAVPLVEGVRSNNAGDAQYAVSESGTLAFVPDTGAAGPSRVLAFVDRDGAVETLRAPPKNYRRPRISPDGERLLVASDEEGRGVLWVYHLAEDRAIQQLTFEGNNLYPIWTPDSQSITFASERAGEQGIYQMPADGSAPATRLTTAEGGAYHAPASWSPDGQTLFFNVIHALTTDWDISTLSVESREIKVLYDAPDAMYLGAEVSPDGRWLAYGSGPDDNDIDIYVEPYPPTGGRRRISQTGGYFPLWSRDGTKLFYRPAANTGLTLRSVDIVTEPDFEYGNEQTLGVEGFSVAVYGRDYDIAPDGERLVMVFPADTVGTEAPVRPRINVVLNWTQELLERVPVD